MDEKPITNTVGPYTVTFSPPIGRGTFATVHKAEHKVTKEVVAAKQLILTDDGTENEYMHQMAERELKIIKGLQEHNNIVQLYDHFNKLGVCWIFLEFCDLKNLSVYLKNNPNLDLMARLKIMYQSTSAIAFMHRQEPPIIHRDVKLENIMMKREGAKDVVKITDFGLSKLCDERQSLSVAFHQGQFMTTTCGSQYFMAPEFSAEFKGGVKYDASVDTYALGLVCLVVLDSGPNVDLLPLSVEAKKSKPYVSIGEEMVAHHRGTHPFPTVVGRLAGDCATVCRIKRIISNMTKFKPIQRKDIQEVEEELLEAIDNLSAEIETKQKIVLLENVLQMGKDRNVQLQVRMQELEGRLTDKENQNRKFCSDIKAVQWEVEVKTQNEARAIVENDNKGKIIGSLTDQLDEVKKCLTHYKSALVDRHKLETEIVSSMEKCEADILQRTSEAMQSLSAAAAQTSIRVPDNQASIPAASYDKPGEHFKSTRPSGQGKRGALTSSTMGPDSMNVRPNENRAPAPPSPLSPVSNTSLQKAYTTIDNNIWILAWITDITKLDVDVVVNAANEQLAHGGGVAYAISKAAGKDLEKDCKQFIKHYGELNITKVCLTTAGKMPSKKVMHAVGPRWSDYKIKDDFKKDLCTTFYNCLYQAQANGYESAALPAISSGIFGGPKEIVVDMAVMALLTFCHKYPFSKVKWIHFVDVVPDIVMCFHERLNTLVRQGRLREDTTYGDYDRWVGGSSTPHYSSSSGRYSATTYGQKEL